MNRYYLNIGDEQNHFCLCKIEENRRQITFSYPVTKEIGAALGIHSTHHPEDKSRDFRTPINHLRQFESGKVKTLLRESLKPITTYEVINAAYFNTSKVNWHNAKPFTKSSYLRKEFLPSSIKSALIYLTQLPLLAILKAWITSLASITSLLTKMPV